MKDIKRKDIKIVDRKNNLEHFQKKKNITTKQTKQNNEGNSDKKVISKNYAVNKTIDVQKNITVNTYIKSNQFIKKQKAKNKNRLKKKKVQNNTIKSKRKNSFVNKLKNNPIQSEKKIKKNTFIPLSSPNTYNHKMKLYMIAKHKKKIKNTPEKKSVLKKTTNISIKVLKSTFHMIKKTTTSINKLISIGIGFIIIIVIILFIGVFSALSDDSTINSATLPVSNEVLEYKTVIEYYAKQYEMEEYVPLIMAVMMQESGGIEKDPMKSSECEYNTKYPKKPNGITDPDYSIKVGIQNLAECLKNAKVTNPSDTPHISLALQGYNYGNGYIQWAVKHFRGYTRANAKVFGDEMKAKLQTDVYGDPEYVPHVLRYYHISSSNIILIAKSQIGNIGGKKYWKWYGFNERVEWCACFVSWVANESGDLNVTIPKFSKVEDGISWYKKHNKWKTENYIPKSGDLIFFDWNNVNDPDHVGIIEKVKNNVIYTIEGNSSDRCQEKFYNQTSKFIFGYGITK